MKKTLSLTINTGLFAALLFLMFNFQSCTSGKDLASNKTDFHGNTDLSHVVLHHQGAAAMTPQDQKTATTAPETAQTAPATVTTPATVAQPSAPAADASASTTTALPKFKNAKQLYEVLTTEERTVVKNKVTTMFAKKPMIKTMALKKMGKLDKKYPAPAKSTISANGGSLTTGEILAIVAIILSVFFVLGIAGIIVGAIALHKINNDGGRSWAKVLAILAIVFGAISFIAFLAWLIAVVIIVHHTGAVI